MLTNKRTWLITLVLVLVAGVGAVALRRTVFSDDGERPGKVQVSLPDDPVGSGADEPGEVRVYVDNLGPKVSVSVRSDKRPCATSLEVDLGTSAPRWSAASTPVGQCAPIVTAEPTSLLTRLDYPRRCLGADTSTVDASVTLDGKAPVTASAKRTEKPNVLLIMVDDMRTDELQWMPNVQKLIGDQGVTFNNGFASLPLCCPARASVLTGLYPHNHGVWSHEAPWGFSALRDEDTLPVWMQRAGYYTTYMGKYLNGYGSTPEPGKKTGTSTQYCPPGWDLWRGSVDGGMDPDDPQDGGTYRFFDTTLNDNCNGYLPLGPTYQTTAYGKLASEQLVADKRAGQALVQLRLVHRAAPRGAGGVRRPRLPGHPGPAEADLGGVRHVHQEGARRRLARPRPQRQADPDHQVTAERRGEGGDAEGDPAARRDRLPGRPAGQEDPGHPQVHRPARQHPGHLHQRQRLLPR